jgi:phosphocarrier protein HPr
MHEITLTVRHPEGLHARPAALFVKTAIKFTSDIQVRYGEKEADAKSILSILTLGVAMDATITIQANGDDSLQAVEALTNLIQSNFE